MVQGCCDGIASILICDSKRIAPTECLPSLSSQARWSIYDIDDVADKWCQLLASIHALFHGVRAFQLKQIVVDDGDRIELIVKDLLSTPTRKKSFFT